MFRQRGASAIGWLIILIFVAFVALIGIRVVPVYAEALTVKSVLNGLQTDNDLSRNDPGAVLQSLQKRLGINDVDSVKRENIRLETTEYGLEVIVDYEARFPLIANIDGIAAFTQKAIIRH